MLQSFQLVEGMVEIVLPWLDPMREGRGRERERGGGGSERERGGERGGSIFITYHKAMPYL